MSETAKIPLDYAHMMVLFENACRDFLKEKEDEIVEKAIEILDKRLGEISIAAVFNCIKELDWERVWAETLRDMEFDFLLRSAIREVLKEMLEAQIKKIKHRIPEIVKSEIKIVEEKAKGELK